MTDAEIYIHFAVTCLTFILFPLAVAAGLGAAVGIMGWQPAFFVLAFTFVLNAVAYLDSIEGGIRRLESIFAGQRVNK
jgi:hypothetical protein